MIAGAHDDEPIRAASEIEQSGGLRDAVGRVRVVDRQHEVRAREDLHLGSGLTRTLRSDAQSRLRGGLRTRAATDREDHGRTPVTLILGIPWGGLAHGVTLPKPT